MIQFDSSEDPLVDEKNSEEIRVADNISVNWGLAIVQIKPELWVVIDFEVVKQESLVINTLNFLNEMSPAFIRIHRAGLVNRWTSKTTRDWDKELINLYAISELKG